MNRKLICLIAAAVLVLSSTMYSALIPTTYKDAENFMVFGDLTNDNTVKLKLCISSPSPTIGQFSTGTAVVLPEKSKVTELQHYGPAKNAISKYSISIYEYPGSSGPAGTQKLVDILVNTPDGILYDPDYVVDQGYYHKVLTFQFTGKTPSIK